MSILCGIQRYDDRPLTEAELLELGKATDRYAPKGIDTLASSRIGMAVQADHTHQRSHLGCLLTDAHGNMVSFDGRLDNHQELTASLKLNSEECSDPYILLAAFARYGEDCFSLFVGDWAIALWSSTDRTLYLARDHSGIRTLYYELRAGVLLWSTYLETLTVHKSSYDLDEEYAARYLACCPIEDRTPFTGLRSVPPAHYAKFRHGNLSCVRHWSWIPGDEIRYKSDSEYEEHFSHLFHRSVGRRVGNGCSVLAELSGGMDSTSIVCVADQILRGQGASSKDLIDTISYYDDAEASWNEKPYFEAVETQRGKLGVHIDMARLRRTFKPASGRLSPFPGADNGTEEQEQYVLQCLGGNAHRVILSGIGGDELLGGVPDPLAELGDYLAHGQILTFGRRALAWSLSTRRSVFGLTLETIRRTAALYHRAADSSKVPPWLNVRLRPLCKASHLRREGVLTSMRLRPSALTNAYAWWSILETLANRVPAYLHRPEYRYPFLDRDLIEAILRFPPEQFVRPGQKRSLMRRALRGVVPDLVLNRRRKGHYSQGQIRALQVEYAEIQELFTNPCAESMGYLDAARIIKCLELACRGDSAWVFALFRAAGYELWLRASGFRATA